jgi:hypothetical protein
MGVASVLVAATNADGSFKQPALAAFSFGVFWGLFSLLGVYLWMFSQKYRLELADNTVRQTGVFTQKQIALLSVADVNWRNRPHGGSLTLNGTDSKMSIEFGTVPPIERDALIEFFHSTIPSQHQHGWDNFLFNPERVREQRPMSPIGRAMIFYLFSVSFAICWFWGLGLANLFGAVVNGVFATYLLTRGLRT